MKKRHVLLATSMIWVVLIAGCFSEWVTQPVATKVSYSPAVQTLNIADMKKVAVIPFADYSGAQPFETAPGMGVNQRVLEEVTDHLVARGIEVAVQEDVDGLLISSGALILAQNKKDRSTLEAEFRDAFHTRVMQKDMAHLLTGERVFGVSKGGNDPSDWEGFSVGLSKEMLKKIGSELGVDKVLRGRIIDYGITRTKSLNPANGVLSVALGGLLEGMGAFAYRDSYESGLPPATFMDPDIYGDRLIVEGGMEIPPQEKISEVQVRLYLQDVQTGQVLWSNRAQVRYSPGSNLNFAEAQPRRMLDAAVKSAVGAMMDDLFKQAPATT